MSSYVHRRGARLMLGALALFGMLGFALRAGHTSAAPAAPVIPTPTAFQSDVKPLLQTACVKCHNDKKHKGEVNFAALTDDRSVLRQKKVWRKAVEQVESKDMPPEDETPLTDAQRGQLLRGMKQILATESNDPADRDPGPAPLRRLTRAEYNLTIRDLVGIDFDAATAVGLTEDTPAHGFSNLANGLTLPPALLDKYFAAADQILDQIIPPTDPALQSSRLRPDGNKQKKLQQAHDAIFFARPGDGTSPRDAARKIIERFASRAFRRPVKPQELDRLMKLFDLASGRGASFDVSVRLMLKGVLVSPHFLLRVEQDRPTPQVYPVSDYELATRLSYFLWSSMPDDALFALAEQKKLSEPGELERQVKRMLADPKAKALTDNFGVQWLQARKVFDARPQTEFFPTFNGRLRQAMYDETVTFFDHLRTDDRPITDLLDADYTYCNQTLAAHYGLSGVKGDKMQRVALKPSDHRGGLLGMAAVAALTSHTSRTSPTLRGKYVLDVIFGTPPPPPPANAGMFKDEKKGKEAKTFREQLAMHVSDASCAGCHRKMDPLGFGLENYDAIGRWRDNAGGQPLDNTGKLVTGESFTGSDELKQIILAKKDQFVRNVVEQTLVYALGRELDYYDDATTKEICSSLEKDGYRFSTLINGVVKCYAFQNRRRE